MPSVVCPASQEKVNENSVRTIALMVIIVSFTGIYLKSPIIFMVLSGDFYLRAFTKGKYSPLKYMAKRAVFYFRIPEKMTDAAPKKFAAGMGFFVTAAIAGCLWLQYDLYAEALAAVLLVCAALESLKGFCLGCIIYTYVVFPFLSKDNSEQSTISINL